MKWRQRSMPKRTKERIKSKRTVKKYKTTAIERKRSREYYHRRRKYLIQQRKLRQKLQDDAIWNNLTPQQKLENMLKFALDELRRLECHSINTLK